MTATPRSYMGWRGACSATLVPPKMCSKRFSCSSGEGRIRLTPPGEASVDGWLFCHATAQSIIRRLRVEVDITDLGLSLDCNLEGETEQRIVIEKVRSVIADMPENQRMALQMALFEGLTHAEIAERVSQPLGTIKTRIRSGLQALRKAMAS